MKFLVDAQLPKALARWLTEQGYSSRHVSDLSMDVSRDIEIWTIAKNDGWIIITKDDDFVQLATVDPGGAPVVWLRVGNCRRQFLLDWFSRLLPAIVEELTNGEQIVEVI